MAGCGHPFPACYFTSFTGLHMHVSLSRPTRMPGQLAWAGLDARAGQASMSCIVQGTTPGRVHAEIRYLLGDPDMLKVHVHVHETEFTAQNIMNICLSHSSTKDPVKVSMHALACALRLHGCALAMCVYFTENTGFDSCTC